MKSFASPSQMLDAHEAMFGDAGRRAAEIVLDLAPRLFAVPLDPLSVRVVLAPFQLSGYNRASGYCLPVGDQHLILGNHHKCAGCSDKIALTKNFADFICHELTHIRQDQLLREHAGDWGWSQRAATSTAIKAGLPPSVRARRTISASRSPGTFGRNVTTPTP